MANFKCAMESLEEQLFSAVNRGDSNCVTYLLAQGANVNTVCDSGRTPLGTAAELGNTAILQILLDASTPPLKQDQESQHHQRRHKGKKSKRDHGQGGEPRNSVSIPRSIGRGGRQDESICDVVHHKHTVGELNIQTSDAPMDEACNKMEKNNLGYFIVVHKDGNVLQSPSSVDDHKVRTVDEKWNQGGKGSDISACALNDIRTPDGMDRLEWDVEVEDGEKECEGGEDSWASLYRWYADILDRTGSLLQLPQQCDVNHQDLYGRCAMHYAAEQGHVDALRLLTAAGCRVDICDSDNLTPLHLAALRGRFQVVEMLLRAGVEVNRKTSDKTSALHIAASRGFVDTVWVLLEHGAYIDALDASDRTPLMLAVLRGHEDVVALLIKHGAKVNIEEIHGYTPLCEAVWQKLVPLVQLLLDAGAKVTQSHFLLHYAVMHRHLAMVELLLRAGSIVNLRDDNGDSPLIVAARTGHCQLAELLLKNGASVNYPNALTGSMPLHEATEYIRESQFETFESMFKVFRSYGAVLNVQTCTGGDTPLFRAILLEKDRAASLLIRHGTDVNMCDVESCVVDNLTLARKRKNFPLVRMLVYAGFHLQHCTFNIAQVSDASLFRTDTITSWLSCMKSNPMRLTDLCRLVIRRGMGEKVYEKVTDCYLPHTLKKFLLLEDLDMEV